MAAVARHGDIITDVTELSVSVETREPGSPIVVRLAGEADVTTTALADVLAAETAKKPRLLLVDVSELTFIDSAALEEFSRANRRLRADGGRLALVGPTGPVARIIELTALDQVFPVYASVEEVGR
jgi:anti-sigma B factor antagonist